ncbi:hypothetical protein KCU78_g598, partial [Aureobasidium melanogenum]
MLPKASGQLTLGDNSTGVDVDEFDQSNAYAPSTQRRRQTQGCRDDDGDEDDDQVAKSIPDWAHLAASPSAPTQHLEQNMAPALTDAAEAVAASEPTNGVTEGAPADATLSTTGEVRKSSLADLANGDCDVPGTEVSESDSAAVIVDDSTSFASTNAVATKENLPLPTDTMMQSLSTSPKAWALTTFSPAPGVLLLVTLLDKHRQGSRQHCII